MAEITRARDATRYLLFALRGCGFFFDGFSISFALVRRPPRNFLIFVSRAKREISIDITMRVEFHNNPKATARLEPNTAPAPFRVTANTKARRITCGRLRWHRSILLLRRPHLRPPRPLSGCNSLSACCRHLPFWLRRLTACLCPSPFLREADSPATSSRHRAPRSRVLRPTAHLA